MDTFRPYRANIEVLKCPEKHPKFVDTFRPYRADYEGSALASRKIHFSLDTVSHLMPVDGHRSGSCQDDPLKGAAAG